MSLLFKHFYDGDVDKFRALLAPAGHHNAHPASRGYSSGGGGGGIGGGSPSAFATSPKAVMKPRKASGWGAGYGGGKHGGSTLGKSEVNARDHMGLTVLLRAASSTAENAIEFVEALLDHPAIDMYIQDWENGWNCLHRAFYAGNISIARLLLDKERRNISGETIGASVGKVGYLIRTKDHEGNAPFDLFNSTIGERATNDDVHYDSSDDEGELRAPTRPPRRSLLNSAVNYLGFCDIPVHIDGDELFTFGSNKNLSLGLGDQDDRQFPERVYLQRPDHLLARFHQEYLDKSGHGGNYSTDVSKIPALIRSRPLTIRDVVLSKLHSAVLTNDPCSNLYVCGVGRGGRLGLGDENTRFNYVCVQGGLAGKQVVQVALGQNHTMALTMDGELWTWGSNATSQLGYTLPPPASADEEPISTLPTKVYGTLKKEMILGVAASAIHSVAHTGNALYCWGKNVGQLGLMDADSRSLEVQQTPRKVAASVLTRPIVTVAAIDKATVCLLDNHAVICFTSYGYNYVKFPVAEPGYVPKAVLPEYNLRNRIHRITAAGETIAAVNGGGQLFTFGLNQKTEESAAATSTTNPSKIKTAVTTPQLIWNAKRDGVRSVSIGEHGSVIVCTRSGAVWKRVRRTKAKDTYASGLSGPKRHDFKFQRVPYITNIFQVAASPFGAFAAIRKDSDLMRREIDVDGQTLWDDVAALSPVSDFKASNAEGEGTTADFDSKATIKNRLLPVAYEVLRSTDLETDLQRYLETWSYANEPLDAAISTSSNPELAIPVHGWLLSSRSSVLRQALMRFRKDGSSLYPETFTVEDVGGRTIITFLGLDIISILNLVVYMYDDKVIPAWNFTREAPSMAFRYRQVRTELMKVSTRLNMMGLEKAVRMQVNSERQLDRDLEAAYHAPEFFEDGDVLLELDGAVVPAHSSLLCQRCPWFRTLYQGRSGGMWLAGRREAQDGDRLKIDLAHMDSNTFKYVLRHIYADTGENMFDDVATPTVDDFMDLVMDVMSIANELMLDRLSQICQKVMGKFVNTRNIAWLLNDISPCAVTEFKDAGLEYICLQMETMLENHLLDDLDDDLLFDLDGMVRENQLANQPFVRSGRTELLLHEKHPELAGDIDEERQIRVKEMAFRIVQRDEEKRAVAASKGRYGSLDETATPPADRARKVSKAARNEPFSPDLRPKQSQNDLMFDMDDEDASTVDSPSARASKRAEYRPALPSAGIAASPGAELGSSPQLPRSQRTVPVVDQTAEQSTPTKSGAPWKASPLPMAKLDLRDVFKPASPAGPSGISAGLAAQKMKDSAPKPAQPKMSQKERKKQQQAQAAEAALAAAASQSPKPAWDKSSKDQASVPWKIASSAKGKSPATTTPVGSLPQASAVPKPLVAAEVSPHVSRRTASPDTRFSGQSRTSSSSNLAPPTRPPVRGSSATLVQSSSSLPKPGPAAGPSAAAAASPSTPLVPHSKSYITRPPKNEPLLGLSIADIMENEQRERQVVKEAVAKRSLQEIQQEQEFQQWWEAESRRTQEEEARRINPGRAGKGVSGSRDDAGEGKRGSGRRGRGGGKSNRGGGGGAGGGAEARRQSSSGRLEGPGKGSAGRGTGRRGRGGGGAASAMGASGGGAV